MGSSGPDDDRETTTLEVRRDAIGETRLVTEAHDPTHLDFGDVRLHIDRFAITANNITYAVFGDALGYWDFFPTADGAFGRVPAMGWATVVETRAPDITLGRRFYGWFPMASHVAVTATATRDGFRDDGAHREHHAPVYRAYVATDADPMYPAGASTEDGEDRHALLRGLFLTGFLAEEFFADGGGGDAPYFGAPRVIVLSASSKTAIGFAQRASLRPGVEVIGVTSPGNMEMVSALGFYDSVVGYDDIATIPNDGGAVSIDMAGNPRSLAAVHARFGDTLRYSMTVGRSHHDAPASASGPMAGPKPQMFFAPSEVGRRIDEWGRVEYGRRCGHALTEFIDASAAWLRVEHRTGPEATQSAWAEVYAGEVAADVGIVATVAGGR